MPASVPPHCSQLATGTLSSENTPLSCAHLHRAASHFSAPPSQMLAMHQVLGGPAKQYPVQPLQSVCGPVVSRPVTQNHPGPMAFAPTVPGPCSVHIW